MQRVRQRIQFTIVPDKTYQSTYRWEELRVRNLSQEVPIIEQFEPPLTHPQRNQALLMHDLRQVVQSSHRVNISHPNSYQRKAVHLRSLWKIVCHPVPRGPPPQDALRSVTHSLWLKITNGAMIQESAHFLASNATKLSSKKLTCKGTKPCTRG
jgi:hypothetical protein